MTNQFEMLSGDLRSFTPDELHTARTVLIQIGRAAGCSTPELADVLQAAGLPLERDIWPTPGIGPDTGSDGDNP